MNKDQNIGYTRGVAYAIAMMQKDGCLTAQDLLNECGITFKEFVKDGVCACDLKEIDKLEFADEKVEEGCGKNTGCSSCGDFGVDSRGNHGVVLCEDCDKQDVDEKEGEQ